MVNRRSFLAGLMALPIMARVATPVSAAPSEAEHDVRGWHVRWSGWKEAANQIVPFGYWWAWHESQPDWINLCTTLGRQQRVHPFGVIDLSWGDAIEPYAVAGPTAGRAREAAKRAAYATLVQSLPRIVRVETKDTREVA